MGKSKKVPPGKILRTSALLAIGGAWALVLWRYDASIAVGALLIVVAGALSLERLENVRAFSRAQTLGIQAVFWLAVVALPLAYLLEKAIGALGPVALLIGVGSAAAMWWKVNIRDQEVCVALRTKGLQLVAKGEWVAAEPVLKKALNQAMQLKANRSDVLGHAFLDLSGLYVKLNRWAEAQEYCLRAITTMEDPANGANRQLPAALETLARINARQRNFASFESILDKSYNMAAGQLGEKTPEATAKLFEYARLCNEEGRHATAARYFQACALKIEEAIGAKAEPLALCLHYAGQASARGGDWAAAAKYFEKAAATHGSIFGPADPKVAPAVEALGEALLAQGQVRPAIQHFQRALAIREDELGANHRAVGRILARLAECYAAAGDHALAERNALRATAILEKANDRHLHTATGTLARVKASLGDMNSADSLYALAIVQARKSNHGQGHLASYLEHRSKIMERLGRQGEAKELASQLEEMRQAVA